MASETAMTPENAAEAARWISGATIAWGAGRYFDFENPEPMNMTFEDYAYALAFTVRWRGQTRSGGNRLFYGVGEHCVRMAAHIFIDGHGAANALAALTHESDEVPFGDIPGPVKPLIPDTVALVKKCGAAIDRHFGFTCPDPALIKRYDIRMLVTERRDLLSVHSGEIWTNGGSGQTSTEGFEPFAERIIPYHHPAFAAEAMIEMFNKLQSLI